jgi:Heterokaryon incompatibility protein (HET)
MRLLKLEDNGEFSLIEFIGNKIPRYAILSHTWGADGEEVTFKDLIKGTGKSKAGYQKIRFCGEQAATDGLQYLWVDTCCINKSSSAELSEAINSIFRWYHNAGKCYVYLSDVSISGSIKNNQVSQTWEPAFQKSRWFTRGWTLQELIAPTSVKFFSVEGERLGNKKLLERQIHEITGITAQALQGSPLSHFSVNKRISWAAKRETKREEDAAYSLLGIFDIHMPLIYGEGREKALGRLHKEIRESLTDKSPALPSALFSKHKDAFKRQEGTASMSLSYLLILMTQLMTLLGSYHSNEIPSLPVVSPSSQSLKKRYLLEVKPQRSQSWGLAV